MFDTLVHSIIRFLVHVRAFKLAKVSFRCKCGKGNGIPHTSVIVVAYPRLCGHWIVNRVAEDMGKSPNVTSILTEWDWNPRKELISRLRGALTERQPTENPFTVH